MEERQRSFETAVRKFKIKLTITKTPSNCWEKCKTVPQTAWRTLVMTVTRVLVSPRQRWFPTIKLLIETELKSCLVQKRRNASVERPAASSPTFVLGPGTTSWVASGRMRSRHFLFPAHCLSGHANKYMCTDRQCWPFIYWLINGDKYLSSVANKHTRTLSRHTNMLIF